jgi:lysophospholipase L1-like esterase
MHCPVVRASRLPASLRYDGFEHHARVGEDVAEAAPARYGCRLNCWVKKLALLGMSTLLIFVALEIAFRLFGYRPLYEVYSKPEVFWKHDPMLGWSLQPKAEGEFVGPRPFPVQFRAPIRINSLGFRDGELLDVPEEGYRILLLGDSQAAGFEVPSERTYAALVEQQLIRDFGVPVQVINAAVRGYGTDQAYLLYRKQGRALRPDVVVYHATANDPEDNTTLHRIRRLFGKPAFALQPDGSLRMVGYPVPKYPLCSAYRLDDDFRVRRIDTARTRLFCWLDTRLADRSALFSFIVMHIERNPRLVNILYGLGTPKGPPERPAAPASVTERSGTDITPTPVPSGGSPAHAVASDTPPQLDYAHRLTSVLIRNLAAIVRQDGARFVLLIEEADLDQLDVQGFRRDGIEIVWADQGLGLDPAAVRFPNDGHLNELGHIRIAEILAPRITELLRP